MSRTDMAIRASVCMKLVADTCGAVGVGMKRQHMLSYVGLDECQRSP
jgi:hypothetical protein